jgi:O-antigen/teichoic acid export membrane protein
VEPVPPPGRGARASIATAARDGTIWLLLGSIVGGVGAYLFQIVGTRSLGERGYAPIATLWTIQYLSWSIVLHAIETYVDRTVVAGRAKGAFLGPRAVVRLWGWIVATSLAVAALAHAFRTSVFGGADELAIVAGVTVAAFGAFALVRGRLAGEGLYAAYGAASATESSVRLVAALWVLAAFGTATALAWTLPVGAATAAAGGWLASRVLRRPRAAPMAHAERAASGGGPGGFLAVTTAANAAAQLLLAGGPLVVAVLGGSDAEVSVFFVTATAARIPVVLALSGGLSRALPAFIRAIEVSGPDMTRSLAWRVAGATLALAAVGGLFGAAAGPALISIFFGLGFTPPWWLAAVVGCGVLVATGGMLLNHLAIAARVQQRLPVPWWLGVTAATAAVLALPGSATARVTTGFAVGLATTFAGLVMTLTRRLDQ